MNRGLWMNDDVDLVRAHAKKPARLDHFKTLVHHRCRIDGNAVSHAPVGVRESLLGSDVCQPSEGRLSKRPARGGQKHAANFSVYSAAQALIDSIVLAIYGPQITPNRFRRGHR